MRGHPPQGAMEKVEQRYASSTGWEQQVMDNNAETKSWSGWGWGVARVCQDCEEIMVS